MAGKLYVVGEHQVKAGQKVTGSLGSVYLPDGNRVHLPFVAINGKGDGPTLTVTAGVHGQEVAGIGALIKVINSLDPNNLRGTFVAITAGNPFAVQVGSYITGLDHKNMCSTVMRNTTEDGSVTERLGFALSKALRASDYVMDFHGNPYPSMSFVLASLKVAKDDATREKILRMHAAFGVTRILSNRDTVASLRDFCSEVGIPAITPELHHGHFLMEENTEVGFTGVTNVMKALNMLDGDLVKQKVPVLEGNWRAGGKLRTQTGGFMFPQVKPGQLIPKNTVVAKLYSIYGDLLEEVRIPFPGSMWSFTGGPGGTHALIEGEDIGYTFCDEKDWVGMGRETGGRGR